MDTLSDRLVGRLREAHRCRPEVRQLAEKMASLSCGDYDALATRLIESGEDRALGILLNVVAVNKVRLDPAVLADALKVVEMITTDPFRVRSINAEHQVEEIDRSDELLKLLQAEEIDAVIAVTGGRALSIVWKLSRKGLRTVCVPKSVENDMASTMLSFGFNSALSFAVETLDSARQAAKSSRKIGIVEVLGEHAGWLAQQAGMAVCADAVLIPEIPYDINMVASKLRKKFQAGSTSALVVVAEGARMGQRGDAAGFQDDIDHLPR